MDMAEYNETHPLPFIVTHWINLVCMICLILTGFYIHFPAFDGFMSIARGVHVLCGIVIFVNIVVRLILTFIIKSAPANGTREVKTDIHSWLPQKDNRHQLIAWVSYYLFLRKEHPLGGKYGVLQKISYVLIPFLLLFMAYTGFALWEPTSNLPFFAAGVEAFGGMMSMRIIHYFMMFVFILFMFIHVYLSFAEGGTGMLKLMLFNKPHGGLTYDLNTHNISGEDERNLE